MFVLDNSKKLDIKNPAYKRAVELYVWQAYLQDIGSGDATSNMFLKTGQKKVTAQIVANGSFILAGIQDAKWFLGRVGIRLVTAIKDGSIVKKGDTIMKISCNPKKLLSAERTLLNLLQHMSGVATVTNKLVSLLPKNIKLLATRKTLWGMLDKRAVSVGGGCTHRLNLDDAILVKENHQSLSTDRTSDFKRVLKYAKGVGFIEIELQSEKDVQWLLKNFSNPDSRIPVIAMLDNMTPQQVKKFAPLLKKSGYTVEVSGGIDEKNILSFCVPGVSAMSSSAMTMRAGGVDMSLNF